MEQFLFYFSSEGGCWQTLAVHEVGTSEWLPSVAYKAWGLDALGGESYLVALDAYGSWHEHSILFCNLEAGW